MISFVFHYHHYYPFSFSFLFRQQVTSESVPDTYIRLALMHQTKVRNATNFKNVFNDKMPREDLPRSLPESLIYLNYKWP